MPKMQNVSKYGIALFVGVVLAMVTFSVASMDATIHEVTVDTESELNSAIVSSSGVNVTSDGTVLLNDSATSGSFTTEQYTNVTEVHSGVDLGNGSLNVTVTGYDAGATQVSQQTYNLADGERVDFSGQAGVDFEFQYDFSRQATGDESPSLDYYKVYSLGQISMMEYIVPLFLILLIGALGRRAFN